MTEEEKIELSAMNATNQKSLELLFDYTKFHIGLYLTLTAAYITAATAKINAIPILTLAPKFVWLAIGAFMVAGLAGGALRAASRKLRHGVPNNFSSSRLDHGIGTCFIFLLEFGRGSSTRFFGSA